MLPREVRLLFVATQLFWYNVFVSQLVLYFCCRVGQARAKSHQDIQLSGENILDEHCFLEHTQGK